MGTTDHIFYAYVTDDANERPTADYIRDERVEVRAGSETPDLEAIAEKALEEYDDATAEYPDGEGYVWLVTPEGAVRGFKVYRDYSPTYTAYEHGDR